MDWSALVDAQRTDLAADEGIDLAVRDLGELADRLEA